MVLAAAARAVGRLGGRGAGCEPRQGPPPRLSRPAASFGFRTGTPPVVTSNAVMENLSFQGCFSNAACRRLTHDG